MPLGRRFNSCAEATNDEKESENINVNKQKEQKQIAKPAQNMFSVIEPQFSFDDIILNSSTYDQIQDSLAFLANRDLIFNEWGLGQTHKMQNKSGINFFGASGTGKTMAAHAVANQLGRKLLIVDYSQIESKYVGETSKNITLLFSHAREMNAIIFFDEADALLSKRVRNMENSTDTSVNQTRSHLLLKLNEHDDIIIFATNFIENYDPAFMRRIATHVKFELPDEAARKKLWRLYIPFEMPNSADIENLARECDGITGADIQNAVMTAALKAARQKESFVPNEYFLQAIIKIQEAKKYNIKSVVYQKSHQTSDEEKQGDV